MLNKIKQDVCCVSDFGSMEKILFQNYELDIGHNETNMHFYYSCFSQYVLEIDQYLETNDNRKVLAPLKNH